MTPDTERDILRGSLVPDADSRPEDVWRWAHAEENAGHWVSSGPQLPLRAWAYVMWDRERLDGWGELMEPWGWFDSKAFEAEEEARMEALREEWKGRLREIGWC